MTARELIAEVLRDAVLHPFDAYQPTVSRATAERLARALQKALDYIEPDARPGLDLSSNERRTRYRATNTLAAIEAECE